MWDSENGFTEIDVPHKPADQVFRLMEKREVQDTQARLNDFLATIDQTSINITSTESVMEHIRTLNLGTEVEKLIEELLSNA